MFSRPQTPEQFPESFDPIQRSGGMSPQTLQPEAIAAVSAPDPQPWLPPEVSRSDSTPLDLPLPALPIPAISPRSNRGRELVQAAEVRGNSYGAC